MRDQTTVRISGTRRNRQYEAVINFFGPPPFALDTNDMEDVTVEINGKPMRARFVIEVQP